MKLWIALLAVAFAANTAQAASTAFINVNVIPMSSEVVIGAQTVVVADGVITAIGDVDRVPIDPAATSDDRQCGRDRYVAAGVAGHDDG